MLYLLLNLISSIFTMWLSSHPLLWLIGICCVSLFPHISDVYNGNLHWHPNLFDTIFNDQPLFLLLWFCLSTRQSKIYLLIPFWWQFSLLSLISSSVAPFPGNLCGDIACAAFGHSILELSKPCVRFESSSPIFGRGASHRRIGAYFSHSLLMYFPHAWLAASRRRLSPDRCNH